MTLFESIHTWRIRYSIRIYIYTYRTRGSKVYVSMSDLNNYIKPRDLVCTIILVMRVVS